ncbi:MAG: peptidylprolyl isomerase [Cyanobacteria bacterium J06639_1]
MSPPSTIFPGSFPNGFVVSKQPPSASPPTALYVGDRALVGDDLLSLLVRYKMLPQLVREAVVDEAIASVELDTAVEQSAYADFLKRQQLDNDEALAEWLTRHGLEEAQLKDLAARDRRIAAFKAQTFDPKIESHFLKRKGKLDRVVYSLLRTREASVAQELYFRIQAGEQTFAQVAKEFSEGPEAQTGGVIGPVELNTPHPALAQRLSVSHPGQLWPPIRLEDWFIIVRLEKTIPAQLDDSTRQRLRDELFATWLQEQLKSRDISIRPLGSASPMASAQAEAAESRAAVDSTGSSDSTDPEAQS